MPADDFISIRLLCEAIPVAAIVTDHEHTVIMFNKSAENLFGMTSQVALERKIQDFTGSLGIPANHILHAALAGNMPLAAEEVSIFVNNHPTLVSVEVFPCYHSMANIILFKDLNLSREAENRIQHLEVLSVIGEMAAGTVHEIRNPLTSIGGFIQLLRTRAARKNDQRSVDYCNMITEEIYHINNILSDFLTLAKPQENKLSQLDITQLLKDVLALMYGEAMLAQITINRNLPVGPLNVFGNPEKIKEVIINICRNAFQAMGPGGTLTLSADADQTSVMIKLADNGPGMPDTTLRNIFKPFFTTKPNGTGLGLAICQRIMQEHNGVIEVQSLPGQGSVFTLVFPKSREQISETA